MPYVEFDKYWRQFNRTYLVIYPDDKAEQVHVACWAINWTMRRCGPAHSPRRSKKPPPIPNDPFAWFNLGTNYVALNDWPNAATAYDRARQIGLPWRMTWYQFGWFDAYLRTGRYDDVLALADATIKVTPNIEEMYYYKGLALKAQGNLRWRAQPVGTGAETQSQFRAGQDALASL